MILSAMSSLTLLLWTTQTQVEFVTSVDLMVADNMNSTLVTLILNAMILALLALGTLILVLEAWELLISETVEVTCRLVHC
jgi:hypothetical protein